MSGPRVSDSEEAILGFMLLDKGEVPQILCSELDDEDFTSKTNKKIFKAIKDVCISGENPNPISVRERSQCFVADIDERLGKAKGLLEADAQTLLRDIKRCSQLRKVLAACSSGISACQQDGASLDGVMEMLERHLYQGGAAGIGEANEATKTARDVVEAFQKRLAEGGGAEISSGLLDLDRAILGLRKSKVFVVGARPGVGKTAFAGTLSLACVAQGYGVLTFSLEVDKEELLERTIGALADVNIRKLIAPKNISEEEIERIKNAPNSLPSGLWFIDDRTYSVHGIRRRARIIQGRLAREGHRLGLVVVDYLQLAGSAGSDSVSRDQTIGEVSRSLKMMAKELGCTVLALSQLNRGCEYREDKRPMLSDLRESGSIEQDADIVAFLYRDWLYDKSSDPEETELIISKHRGGPLGTIKIKYKEKICQFRNWGKAAEGEPDSSQNSKELEQQGVSSLEEPERNDPGGQV